MKWVLGIDGGGTQCRAGLATTAGEIVGRGDSGAANVMTDLDGTCASIVEAARAAFAAAGQPPDFDRTGAVLGLAGANVADVQQRLAARLPFAESRVESDALIALEGALGGHDGAIGIIGTGSAFMARHGETTRSIGGWGFQIGDLGGGARLGRQLLEESLLAHDGIRAQTALTAAVLARFDQDPRRMVTFAATARPRDFGAFVPVVFDFADQGDPLAARLLDEASAHVEAALAALDLHPTDRLCLLGGLGARIAARLGAPFSAMLRAPIADALGGAVAMAARRFGAAAGH
ncbi:BadF/BadG/BcrA/BcrD ATPase family protein [Nitratireductor sp. StC3]|uniref:BadF/BadG/BcrA/BcrD ATPase family protein n=1 Tax=Nitratireductor sp. StC3 TaxID=2126741 RepID=UPI000D0DC507|nr:BadF/BadG/BcrA/BcrD ATPase family protein [Nitratireductor sp. StC3]PSM16604.1 N-acetylglucosamine kinase [Nitratireductor sp. StC3]